MRYLIAGFVLLLAPIAAQGQPAAPASALEPATVSFVTGLSVGSDQVGPLAGGSLSAGVTPWLSVEGSAGFADRGPGVDGVYAIASAVFNLRPASSRVVPFASAGGGLYHANFDMNSRELFGDLRADMPLDSLMQFIGGQMMIGGRTPGVYTSVHMPGQLPQFYANRIGTMLMDREGRFQGRSFTDPATSIGAGVMIRLSDKVVLRPDARALLVFSEGETNAIGLVNLGLGFRF